jgi:hypothetical protein
MIFTDLYRKISWRGKNLEKKMSHLDQQAVEKKNTINRNDDDDDDDDTKYDDVDDNDDGYDYNGEF